MLLGAAIVATALVQAFVLQSYFVPTAALAPTVEPGDRVLVWKVRPAADPGDLVVVDTTATATVDRSTPVADGLVGRVLSSVADLLDVDIGAQSALGRGRRLDAGCRVPHRTRWPPPCRATRSSAPSCCASGR